MSLTYSQYVAAISELTAIPSTDADFLAVFPNLIDYAEQRIYREVDFLQTVIRDVSGTLTSGNRVFTLPTNSSGTFVCLNALNVYTPVGTLTTRNPLVPASRDFLDLAWPSSTGATVPQYFAMRDQFSVILGPWPDAAYTVETVGTIRPTPLSASNTSTFLSTNLPDLMVAAGMVFAAGYMKNFGAQGDDPKMAQSWEGQYEKLIASALSEEARKKYTGSGWTSQSTGGPFAQPPRN